MTISPVSIAGRSIGPGHAPFIVAEMSANHLGDETRAHVMIDIAADAGADAVKLQTYTADTITIDHDGPEFVLKGGLWDGRKLHDLYEEAHTPWDWHAGLFARGRSKGLVVFSSPFDATAVDLLEDLEAPCYKIASFELVDIPLIRLCASTRKPLIMSTGMASLGEIDRALEAATRAGAPGVILLHCTSGYPTPFSEADLATIPNLMETFGVPVGLSDHTDGVSSSVAAIALGASLVEKHYTIRRADGGPDAAFSLEPDELRTLVTTCRNAHAAIGHVRHKRAASEERSAKVRRSLYVVADIAVGEALTPANVRSIRPGLGLEPRHWDDVIGRIARHPLKRGTPLAWTDIA
jgi:pseudaminic acid synthase